jgi:DNA replicative helicase MCM subunit Mcm2 (Cdc46/Mcm family)
MLSWQAAEVSMPICKSCGDEVEQLVSVRVGTKTKKLCEECADRAREEGEIAEASESAVQQMMDFKGRR